MAPCSLTPRGRASPTDFTTSVSLALTMPPALDPENPASPGDPAHIDTVGALFFAVPEGRTSTKGFATAVAAAPRSHIIEAARRMTASRNLRPGLFNPPNNAFILLSRRHVSLFLFSVQAQAAPLRQALALCSMQERVKCP